MERIKARPFHPSLLGKKVSTFLPESIERKYSQSRVEKTASKNTSVAAIFFSIKPQLAAIISYRIIQQLSFTPITYLFTIIALLVPP